MKSDGKWFVRNTAGKVFGPITFETLQSWVQDGRVEPLAGISEDLQNWMLAPLKQELEMDWVVENNPGQFYGPTHKNVVDDLVKSGTLSPGARFYCDDRGKALKAIDDLNAELEQVKAERSEEEGKTLETIGDLKAELAKSKVDLEQSKVDLEQSKVELENSKAELESSKVELEKFKAELEQSKVELEQSKVELEKSKAELEKSKTELESLKAEKKAVHAREWKTEVLVPEVVVSDEPPPSVARSAFGAINVPGAGTSTFGADKSSLAALERQAQAELARMGSAGAKKFFGIGRRK